MIITHNLIFETKEQADAFVLATFYTKFQHLAGTDTWRYTQHENVIRVPDKTYIKLDAHGLLDGAGYRD